MNKYYEFLVNQDLSELLKIKDFVEQEKDVDQQKINQEFNKIPLEFLDERDYITIWEPLFLEESKANVIKSFETEVYPNMECNIEQVEEGELVLKVKGGLEQIGIKDLVVFSCEIFQDGVKHILGLIDSTQDSVVRVHVSMQRIESFKESLLENIYQKKPFYLRKLCGTSTLEREYRALQKIRDLHLKPLILSLSSDQSNHTYFGIPDLLHSQLKAKFNESQLIAIKQTLKTHGITLIQGPPGTGKTKTVIGTLSVLLSSVKQESSTKYDKKTQMEEEIPQMQESPWCKSDYQDWRDHIFDDVQEDLSAFYNFKQYSKEPQIPMIKNDSSFVKCPEKILVCGPSNASVDEIVKKVLEEGLLDERGLEKRQMIVRIGDNYDQSLSHVSLEGLVNQRMKQDSDPSLIRKEILTQAKIVFGTLSSTGSNVLMLSEQKFDTVIIDEAAQAVEISTLIPLQYGCRRLILIGDHNQLPATVFSKVCEKYKYDQSLFERLEKQGAQVHLLKTQYRMHPSISKFISSSFYSSELKDAENIMDIVGQPAFYKYYTYSPLVVLHTKGYERFVRNSYSNELEAQLIQFLLQDLHQKFPKFNLQNIGVVSPYSAQINLIQRKLRGAVEVKTIDGFQGREKDIIIFSTVRSKFISPDEKNPKKGIGFLSDIRRMNVSLSRCRQCLIVVCDIYKISCNPLWRQLVDYAQDLGTCYRVNEKDLESWFSEFDSNPLKFQLEKKSK